MPARRPGHVSACSCAPGEERERGPGPCPVARWALAGQPQRPQDKGCSEKATDPRKMASRGGGVTASKQRGRLCLRGQRLPPSAAGRPPFLPGTRQSPSAREAGGRPRRVRTRRPPAPEPPPRVGAPPRSAKGRPVPARGRAEGRRGSRAARPAPSRSPSRRVTAPTRAPQPGACVRPPGRPRCSAGGDTCYRGGEARERRAAPGLGWGWSRRGPPRSQYGERGQGRGPRLGDVSPAWTPPLHVQPLPSLVPRDPPVTLWPSVPGTPLPPPNLCPSFPASRSALLPFPQEPLSPHHPSPCDPTDPVPPPLRGAHARPDPQLPAALGSVRRDPGHCRRPGRGRWAAPLHRSCRPAAAHGRSRCPGGRTRVSWTACWEPEAVRAAEGCTPACGRRSSSSSGVCICL